MATAESHGLQVLDQPLRLTAFPVKQFCHTRLRDA